MFQIVEMEDVVRVPPNRFGNPLGEVAGEILKSKYESTMSPETGYRRSNRQDNSRRWSEVS
jgi:DNA-directed RNA polymerase subunit E'/Rpb7